MPKCLHTVLIFSLLLSTFSLSAQIEAARKELAKGNFADAVPLLQKLSQDDAHKMMAHYYLAGAFIDSAYVDRDANKSFQHCLEAERTYEKNKSKKDWKKPRAYRNYDLRQIKKRAQSERVKLVQQSEKSSTIVEFMEANPKLLFSERKSLLSKRNELYLAELKLGTYAEAKAVWTNQDKSLKKVRKDWKKLEKLCFSLYVQENGWEYEAFKNEFKRHEVFLNKPLIAEWDTIRTQADVTLFNAFLSKHTQYRDTFFNEFARDSLAAWQADIELFRSYMEDAVSAEKISAAQDATCVQLMKKSKPLKRFEQQIPSDAVPYLRHTMDYLAEVAMPNTNPEEAYEFLKKYPTYYKAEELREMIYELEKKEHEGSSDSKTAYIQKYAPSRSSFSKLQALIDFPIQHKKWDDALTIAKQFEENFGNDSLYMDLINILEKPTQNIQTQIMGTDSISGPKSEYTPVLSPDGQTFYFCRNASSLFTSEAIYAAKKRADGTWGEAQKVKSLSGAGNLAPVSISDDGNELLIFDCGKLSTSTKTKNGWTEPVAFNKEVNLGTWQGTASISADGTALFFESRASRDGEGTASLGGVDIFISEKQADGTWGPAKNIGNVLNTNGDDRTPFLHSDGQSLYFSSDGHGGLGKMDILMSKRTGPSWFDWSKPQNMGKEINTSSEDWGFRVATNGQSGYFAADPKRKGQSDIFWCDIPEAYRPEPVSAVSTIITDDNGKPVAATVLVKNKSGKVIKTGTTDPETGNFQTTLPNGTDYHLEVIPVSGMKKYVPVNLNSNGEGQLITTTIKTNSIEHLLDSKETVIFSTLEFDYNSDKIRPSSFPELDNMYDNVISNSLALIIHGHTDNHGSELYNKALSKRRAEAVRQYFIQMGLTPNRIETIGFGESKPKVSNETEGGRMVNRRVEVLFRRM